MTPDLARLKIAAYLRAAPEKALLLRGHTGQGRLLQALLLGEGLPAEESRLAQAARWAAAADRVELPRDRWEFFPHFLARPALVHPLAGTRYDLEALPRLSPLRVAAEVRRAVRRLLHRLAPREDPVQRYWLLYRVLPEYLEQSAPPTRSHRLGALWRLLPADTRIPDHAIWEHARLASAFAAALPRPALLLFSLGPVQPYIATARKTADLWAGSFLLSYLLWEALLPVVEAFGADAVLFPELSRQPFLDAWLVHAGHLPADWRERLALPSSSPPLVASLPNRFLALLPAEVAAELAARAEANVRRAVREELWARAQALFTDDEAVRALSADPAAATERQLAPFPRTHWYVLPWLDEETLAGLSGKPAFAGLSPTWEALTEARAAGGPFRANPGGLYPVLQALAEMGHGAVKATRPFSPREEPTPRCSLCGVREALWEATRPGHLREGERLCALCGAKRALPATDLAPQALGLTRTGRPIRFPSTHAVAQVAFWRAVVRALRTGEPAPVVDTACALLEEASGADPSWGLLEGWTVPRLTAEWREVPQPLRSLQYLSADWLLTGTVEAGALRDLASETGAPLSFCRRFAGRARAFLAAVRTHLRVAPGRYYALVHADGDRLGAWLSGRSPGTTLRLEEVLHPELVAAVRKSGDGAWLGARRPLTPARQGAISRALAEHALEVVPRLVHFYYGQLVYAGGDDFLAFFPCEDLLPALEDLRDLFSGRPLREDSPLAKAQGCRSCLGFVRMGRNLQRTLGARATLSAGAVVAHATAPLARVLAAVRAAEREAKDRGRDRLHLRILKRSGAEEGVSLPWRLAHDWRPLAFLEELRRWLAGGLVSRRLVFELRHLLPRLLVTPFLADEANRVLARHCLLEKEPRRAFLRAERTQRFGAGLERLARAVPTAPEEVGRALGVAEFLSGGGEVR